MGPIGVFDSGYGGLTILSDIIQELPEYDYLYLGDNARAPYGTRSFDVIYEFTLEAVKALFDRDCELVILACNTASAKALRTIQQNDLPRIAPDKRVLGVIRPITEMVGEFTQTNHVGVLATQGTVDSRSYAIEIEKFFPEVTVFQKACPMWVPLIENNEHHTPEGRKFIKNDVQSLLSQSPKIDTLLLGCTHYPLVKNEIEKVVPPSINIVSQGKIVASKLKQYLINHPELEAKCSKTRKIEFMTSENTSVFDLNASNYSNFNVKSSHINLADSH